MPEGCQVWLMLEVLMLVVWTTPSAFLLYSSASDITRLLPHIYCCNALKSISIIHVFKVLMIFTANYVKMLESHNCVF